MSDRTSLAVLTHASQLLAEATTIQKAKELKDLALTAQDWAKRKNLGKAAIEHCRRYALLAERRIGELLQPTARATGADIAGRPKQLDGSRALPSNRPPTLAELGLTKRESAEAQALAELSEEQFNEVVARAMPLSSAAKEARKAQREAAVAEVNAAIKAEGVAPPDGLFDVIVIDPPWPYGRGYDSKGSRVASPYPEMALGDLRALELPAKDDCVLYLWTTHAFLWDARALLDAWGFTYKALLVWDKQKMGMGAWLRMQCEFCLLAVRGKPLYQNAEWRDLISEPRREHSRKPEAFYAMVEAVAAGRRLDYFSRTDRAGWACFGAEEGKFDGVAQQT